MTEALNTTEIELTKGGMMLTVKEYDAMGKSSTISVPMPTSSDFREWTLMQQVVMLKKGMWSKASVHEIMFGIAYANSFRGRDGRPILDIMQGDVFPTGDGRIGRANKAKIKIAQATGLILGIQTEMKELDEDGPEGCVLDHDLECTATVHVKGWTHPIVRKGRLTRWYKAKNVNWKENPEYMLELNTVAHACEYVAPGGTEADEAPSPVADVETADVVKQLNAEVIREGGQE